MASQKMLLVTGKPSKGPKSTRPLLMNLGNAVKTWIHPFESNVLNTDGKKDQFKAVATDCQMFTIHDPAPIKKDYQNPSPYLLKHQFDAEELYKRVVSGIVLP